MSLTERLQAIAGVLAETDPDPVTIEFGSWTPDLPALANPGATVAKNVYPAKHSYRPLGALAAATPALDARVRGAIAARDTMGNYYNFAGDAAKLYEVRASGVVDKSKGGGYSTSADEVWEFTIFKGELIATNFDDPVQSIVVSSGLFADLITSTLTPSARHLATVNQHLVLGNTNDATDGNVPYRVWFSAFADIKDFDPDAQTQSDFEDRPDAGWVQRIVGGLDYGLIFQQNQVVRMTRAGGAEVFQFDEIDRKRGTPIPNSVIGHGRLVYFISEEGFFLTDGTQSYPIGENQVDKTLWGQLQVLDASLVSSAIDPVNKLVAWAFPTAPGVRKIFFYDWVDRRFSEAEVDLDILVNTTSERLTLEDLDAIALDPTADTTLDGNEASGQTELSVTDETLFDVGDTVRVTLDDATIHQSTIDSIGSGTITIAVGLPSGATSGNRVVRTSIDALTVSLDSAQWRGGGLSFAAFDTAHKLAYFEGANLKATIETGETEIFAGRFAKTSKMRPLIDGGVITGAVAGRDRLIDAVVFDPSAGLDAIGEIGILNEARYHRFRCEVAAGGDWEHAQGVQILASPMGWGGFT